MIIRAVDGSSLSDLSRGSEKKVIVCCDVCATETSTTFSNYFRSQQKHPGKTFCRKCSCKVFAHKRSGKPAWNKGMEMPERRGKNHPQWKGGSYLSSDGYRVVSDGRKYRREHRVVAEKKLGRKLFSHEVVHHKDGDRLNSDPNNLFVCSQSEHQIAHHSLDKIGYQLFKRGLIIFKNGKYRTTNKLEGL